MTATLWRNTDYLRYWWSRASSVLGSQVSYIAVPLFAKPVVHDNAAQLSLVIVCSYGSALLFALHAGVVGDRFDRKRVMVAADVARALLVGLLAWQAAVGGAQLWELCLIALAVGALSVVFDAAAAAALPDLVGADLFAKAMSRNQSRDFVLALAGPLLGATLLTIGPQWAFAFDAVSYALSALLLGFISTKLTAAPQSRRTVAMIRDGIAVVLKDRLLGRLTLYLSVLNLVLTAAVIATMAHFSPAGVGIALAAQSAGGLLGSLVAERLHRRLSVKAIVAVHGGLWFAGLTATAIAPTTAVVAVGFGLGWLLASALRLALGSRLVAVVRDDMRARANSAISLCTSSFSLLGPPLGGLTIGFVGYGWTMAALGLLAVLAVSIVDTN